MKKIGITADSHSSITQEKAKELGIRVLPMPYYIDGKTYYEDVSIRRDDFFRLQAEGAKITTSQATPTELMDFWNEALKEYEQILYFPISRGLSGSANTAKLLSQEEEYEGRVYVVDNGRTSTPMHVTILDAMELIEEGYEAEKIQEMLECTAEDVSIYLVLNTLEYLKAGGRISKAKATVGSALHIKPILQLDTGMLHSWKNARSMKKAQKIMFDQIHEEMEGRFRDAAEAGELYLMSAVSTTKEEEAEWIAEIEKEFPGYQVIGDELSMGVCCHTGPGGRGIGLAVKTKYAYEHKA